MRVKNKILFFYFLNTFLFFGFLKPKEILCQAETRVKQVKFRVRGGEAFFIEKYENINGKITQIWNMNNNNISKEDYNKFISQAEKEEQDLIKEEQEKKVKEEEEKRKILLAQQEKEKEAFLKQTRLLALKRLVSLELENVQTAFNKLDKYELDNYFVYQVDTFDKPESLFEVKNNLVNQAKQISIKNIEELQEVQLKDILAKLEAVPDRIERFFRQSVKYAVDKCNDTKRLKELLALM